MLNKRQIWRRVKDKNDDSSKYYKKKVNFNERVSVILIPSLNDYKKHKMIEELWYNYNDFKNFYLNRC